jgi:hypothetical protein
VHADLRVFEALPSHGFDRVPKDGFDLSDLDRHAAESNPSEHGSIFPNPRPAVLAAPPKAPSWSSSVAV